MAPKNERHIVAIDLGSSKVSVTVARVNGEDIQVVYYKESPSAGIRNSSIFNDMLVKKTLEKAIHEAETEIGMKITQAVVGMPKYPIRQELSDATIFERKEEEITHEDIAALKRFAQSLYPIEDQSNEAIYGSVAQSFSDGENFQIVEEDIIGMSSTSLEGSFKIFIGKKAGLTKTDSVMDKIGVIPMKKYFTAESTAKAVLTDSEMENGVALIDFGGGSTSVSIYQGRIMRHYASIPFGGKSITADIKSECQIPESLAENIKLEYGACMPDKLLNLSDKILDIVGKDNESSKQLPVKFLSEIITARVEEILMAMFYEIEKSGFADSLRSGIVVTGGCAQTANLCNFIYDLSGYKARVGYPQKRFSCEGYEGICGPSASTTAGLVVACLNETEIDCALTGETSMRAEPMIEDIGVVGTEEDPQGRIFKDGQIEEVARSERHTEDAPRGLFRFKIRKIKETIGDIFEQAYNIVNEDDPDSNSVQEDIMDDEQEKA